MLPLALSLETTGDNNTLHKIWVLPLPPFSALVMEQRLHWLGYVAPEIIRTRGLESALLERADVYALGKTFAALMTGQAPAFDTHTPYDSLTEWVEAPTVPIYVDYGEFGALVARMCAPQPQNRPALTVVLDELRQLRALTPTVADGLRAMLRTEDLPALESALDELDSLYDSPLLGITQAEWHIFKAELLSQHNPPQIEAAIQHLETAAKLSPQAVTVWCRLGDFYQRHTTYKQHLIQAGDAYLKAAHLSQWATNAVHKWMSVIIRYYPQMLLTETNHMPWEQRSPEVFVMRVQVYLMLGQVNEAWSETVRFFEDFHYDEAVIEVALKIEPPIVMLTMRAIYQKDHGGRDWPAASLSVMWARNGNRAESEVALQKARTLRPPLSPQPQTTDCEG